MVSVTWRGHTGAVLGSRLAVHVVTVIVPISQVRITMVGKRQPPGMGIREIKVMGAGSNSRVVRSGVTYPMVVTLLTSQLPMSLLNVDLQALS